MKVIHMVTESTRPGQVSVPHAAPQLSCTAKQCFFAYPPWLCFGANLRVRTALTPPFTRATVVSDNVAPGGKQFSPIYIYIYIYKHTHTHT